MAVLPLPPVRVDDGVAPAAALRGQHVDTPAHDFDRLLRGVKSRLAHSLRSATAAGAGVVYLFAVQRSVRRRYRAVATHHEYPP